MVMEANVSLITIKVGGITTQNIYKPPTTSWLTNFSSSLDNQSSWGSLTATIKCGGTQTMNRMVNISMNGPP